jgi:hypothetical protein
MTAAQQRGWSRYFFVSEANNFDKRAQMPPNDPVAERRRLPDD